MKYLIFILVSLSLCALGGETKLTENMIVRQKMNNISINVRKMGLYIASEREFVKKANRKDVQQNLEKFATAFKQLKDHPAIEIPGLKINQLVMVEQLDQSVSYFKSGNPEISRQKFNGTLSLCVSCHIQSLRIVNNPSLPNKVFSDLDIYNYKLSDLEKAELYFATRDFDRAILFYDKFLSDPKIKNNDELALKSLKNELVYFVKEKENFNEAQKHFELLLKQNSFSEKINLQIEDWIRVLSGKRLESYFGASYNIRKVNEQELANFLTLFTTVEEDAPMYSPSSAFHVYDLNLSSILLDYINLHPETKHGAQIFYWLALMDKRTNSNLLFSLSEFYLLACMEKYNIDPIANKCYQAYIDGKEYRKEELKKKLSLDVFLRVSRLH